MLTLLFRATNCAFLKPFLFVNECLFIDFAAERELRDTQEVAEATGGDPVGQEQLHRHDAVHLLQAQPKGEF